jgi:GNAT superfamily N-acetyltransferase
VEIVRNQRDPDRVESILRGLPEWFGIESAIVDYVDAARTLPSYLAVEDGEVVGVCLVERHFPQAAEVHLLAVDRAWHRRGVGRALMDAVEQDLGDEGVAFLQVKTLGASRESLEYALTRRFYEALGYVALEEFDADTLWPGNPCLVMIKHLPSVVS